MVGPLPKSQEQIYIIVSTDYFSKWIKAKDMVSTTKLQVIKLLKSRIISRYDILDVLINDNGTRFAEKNLKLFYEELKIEHHRASVKHTQTNGKVKATNKIILNGLKKIPDAHKWICTKDLDNVFLG